MSTAAVLFLSVIFAAIPVTASEQPKACSVRIRTGDPKDIPCIKSSGNKALDAKASAFKRNLDGSFNVRSRVCFIDDDPPNAWSWSDGTIMIGRNLIRKEFEEYGNISLWGVMAHEWAHQFQFESGIREDTPVVALELQADCMSGYHLARFGNVTLDEVRNYARSLFAKGDYAFNEPTHHGTPENRLNIVMYGFEKGTEKRTAVPELMKACLDRAVELSKASKKSEKNPVPAAQKGR